MKRLAKAISRCNAVLEEQRSFVVEPSDDFVVKGEHDALFHHMCYAMAARRQDKKEEAKKHFAEFLEAAVESVIGLDAYSMVPALKRTLDYYEQLACDHTSSETNEYNAHYKAGKKYAKFKD